MGVWTENDFQIRMDVHFSLMSSLTNAPTHQTLVNPDTSEMFAPLPSQEFVEVFFCYLSEVVRIPDTIPSTPETYRLTEGDRALWEKIRAFHKFLLVKKKLGKCIDPLSFLGKGQCKGINNSNTKGVLRRSSGPSSLQAIPEFRGCQNQLPDELSLQKKVENHLGSSHLRRLVSEVFCFYPYSKHFSDSTVFEGL